MRTREKKWRDYGIEDTTVPALMSDCRNPAYASKVMAAVTKTTPEWMQEIIFVSLSFGLGFEGTLRQTNALCARNDFYGYRRKAAAEFYHLQQDLHLYQIDDNVLDDARAISCEKLSKYGSSRKKKPHKA